jgi:hypothetical protein
MTTASFKWRKLGHLWSPDSKMAPSWMHSYAQTPSALIFENHIRIYFCTRPVPVKGQFTSLIGFIDVSKSNPMDVIRVSQNPVLKLGAKGCFDEFGTNPVSVIRHGDTIRAYYAGWTRCESVPFNAAIGMAISRDEGHSFERMGPGPVLSYCPDEPYVIGSPKIRCFNDCWYLYYAAGRKWIKAEGRSEPVYRIRSAISSNGIEWKKTGADLIETILGEDECQASADIIYYQGKYHMFFSYRQALNFKNKERGYRIGYAHSNDLIEWHRNDELAGINISDEGWDSEMVSYPNVFVNDGNLFMLYQGNEVGRHGFGLAILEN